MQLQFSLKSKGGGGLAARAGTIAARFGPTAARTQAALDQYIRLLDGFGARPTFPITACVLARHPALIRRFQERGVEFAIHGLVHNDHAALDLETQLTTITRAYGIFNASHVLCSGFRGPYLRYNHLTHRALREMGLRYHCSQAVNFEVLPEAFKQGRKGEAYARALQLYGALDAARVAIRPRQRGGLIDIPVAMPDDEIMVDRLRMTDEQQTAAWLHVLDTAHAHGDLFTIQLHPERIPDCAAALTATLGAAWQRRPGVWIAQLDTIARWWERRARADLDVEETGAGRFHIRLDGDPEATLLVRGLPGVQAAPWYGADMMTQARAFDVAGPLKPVVGVSQQTPAAVRDFLREEGFPLEVSDDPSRFGAYVDHPDSGVNEKELLAALNAAPGPLVRLWRWPNGARSALAVTGDIDSITLQDFALRLWETRQKTALTAAGTLSPARF